MCGGPVSPNNQSVGFSRKISVIGTADAQYIVGTHGTYRKLTMPRRHQPSERCLPLRQLPPEHPYSASPLSLNPVSNGWVLPLFSVGTSLVYALFTYPA